MAYGAHSPWWGRDVLFNLDNNEYPAHSLPVGTGRIGGHLAF